MRKRCATRSRPADARATPKKCASVSAPHDTMSPAQSSPRKAAKTEKAVQRVQDGAVLGALNLDALRVHRHVHRADAGAEEHQRKKEREQARHQGGQQQRGTAGQPAKKRDARAAEAADEVTDEREHRERADGNS